MTDQANPTSVKPGRDSIFGVCAALAADFEFNPLWLRLAIGAGLMVNMEAALAAYVVLSAIVVISRVAAPDAKTRPTPASNVAAVASPEQDVEEVPLARAA